MDITVSLFSSETSNKPQTLTIPWDDWATQLLNHQEQAQKGGRLWSPASYPNGTTRADVNVTALSVAVGDFDHNVSLPDIRKRLAAYEYIIHSTFRHTTEAPRVRVVIPFTRPVVASNWEEIWPRLNYHLWGPSVDAGTKDPSRMYYLPSCPPKAPRITERHQGGYLDPDSLLPLPETPPMRLKVSNNGHDAYVKAAFRGELERLGAARDGERNNQLFKSAAALGEIIATGALGRLEVEDALRTLALDIGLEVKEVEWTIRSGIETGIEKPRALPETSSHKDIAPIMTSTSGQHLTDTGNGKRLAQEHGPVLRYCWAWEKWLAYVDGWWERENAVPVVVEKAKTTVARIYAEASQADDQTERKAIARWAMGSESESRIRSMIALARSEKGIPVLPEELDTDTMLLNVRNGTIDLRSGEVLRHDPARLITRVIPVAYDPDATCPRFLDFLAQVTDGSKALVHFLHKAIGYSLTADISERAIIVCWGNGRNGKTTLLKTIHDLLNTYALRTPTQTLIARKHDNIPNDVARLKGTRYVYASESEEGDKLAEAFIKDATGGDPLSARFMRGEWFDFLPAFKLWLGTNHKPVIKGTDRAIWDRIRLVPFTVRIPDNAVDPELPARLRAEFPGILAWAVEGCLLWQNERLGMPEEIRNATSIYQSEMDDLAAFLEDNCILGATYTVTARELYSQYLRWCLENGEKSTTQKELGLRLTERGFQSARNKKERYWTGLTLAGKTFQEAVTRFEGDA